MEHDAAAEQRAFWNGPATAMWAEQSDRMDASLAPVLDALLARAGVGRGERVLDIGCGAGASVLALADRVGPEGEVLGLDISAPILAVARRRTAGRGNVRLELADAMTHPLAPASADLLFSRFGVMFFGDPKAAFANLRGAVRPGGRLCFACWQRVSENPWVALPMRVIEGFLAPQPPPAPGQPGQFSFADPDRVADILTSAGFAAPSFTGFELAMPLGPSLPAAVERCCAFGTAGRALAEQPETVRRAAAAAVGEVLAPHVRADGSVALTGRVWIVEAGG